jgi:hypothetical protein
MLDSLVLDNIPIELRDRPQWVAWDHEDRNGKPTKVPYSAVTGRRADTTDPETWATLAQAFEHAQSHRLAGVGFVFAADDPYVGIDLDDCLDPQTGELVAEAAKIVAAFDTYTEVSPSGCGLKLIGRGQKPANTKSRTKDVEFGQLEVYERDRFFTITTRVFQDHRDLRDVAHELIELCERLLAKPKATIQASSSVVETVPHPVPDDDKLLDIIRSSRQGEKFRRLFDGDSDDEGDEYGGDESAADFALATILLFWTQKDLARVEHLMLRSGRQRPKWSDMRGHETYLQYTIRRAAEQTDAKWEPNTTTTQDNADQADDNFDDDFDDFDEFNDEPVDPLRQHLDAIIAGKHRPVPFPWLSLTQATAALTPGTITILCGAPGSSKSLLVSQAMAYWAKRQIPAAALMLEGGTKFHLQRALAQEAAESRIGDVAWIEQNAELVRSLHDQHAPLMKSLAQRLFAPGDGQLADLNYVKNWLKSRAKRGDRVLIVDPITMIDGGDKQWVVDRELVAWSLQLAEEFRTSIILVTHPRKGARKPHLDDLAGGATIGRAAHTVLWLEKLNSPRTVSALNADSKQLVEVGIDRRMHILKARYTSGGGSIIGLSLNVQSLRLRDAGIVVAQDSFAEHTGAPT